MRFARSFRFSALAAFLLGGDSLLLGCSSETPKIPEETAHWEIVKSDLPSALLSIWGSSSRDIWAVGGDAEGTGPLVLHYDGTSWAQQDTHSRGDLWWVFGFEGGPLYMGGAGGVILRYANGTFTKMPTPSNETVFGIWGEGPSDLWAVGGASGGGNGAFAWRLDGDSWVTAAGFPDGIAETGAIWKVFGRGSNDVWLVGTNGITLHWDGASFSSHDTGLRESIFTVHATSKRFASVGGYGSGIILENDGNGWTNVTPRGAPALTGVCLTEHGGYAVGFDGAVYSRSADGWQPEETKTDVFESLHAVWIDSTSGVWAVGGQTVSFPLIQGVLIHRVPGGNGEK